MVKGLERFRDHSKNFADRYVLIGGTACDLVLTEAGVEFRGTKDLDIVLCVETIDVEFARAFWTFVTAGGYELQETSSGQKKFYRFKKPKEADFPEMLELFSRVPEALTIADQSHLTPIPIDDEVSSLSAILLNDSYYAWIHDGRRTIAGIPVVGPEPLIPIKAIAWLDLRSRKAAGEEIDSRAVKKHKNDVFRLFAVIDPEFRASLPAIVESDMRRFLDEVSKEPTDLKTLGLASTSIETVLRTMRVIYGLA